MPSSSFANFDTYENCAYYSDTIGAVNAEGGTVVVDVSDPRKPVQTAYLTERATANAGESLRVHRERGLLVADRYFLAQGISNVDDPDANRSLAVYDISKDCRKPKLLADVVMPSARRPRGLLPGRRDGLLHGQHRHDHADRHLRPDEAAGSCPSRSRSASTAARPARTATARTSPTSAPGGWSSPTPPRSRRASRTRRSRSSASSPTPGNAGQQSTIPIFYGGRPHIFNFSEYAELGRAVQRPARPRDELRLPDDRRHRRRAEARRSSRRSSTR